MAIVDVNGLQQQGWLDQDTGRRQPPYDIEVLRQRWQAFGWRTQIVDGHDYAALVTVLGEPREAEGPPTVVLARTVKGKGVSFMEHQPVWHNKVPSADELARALKELVG